MIDKDKSEEIRELARDIMSIVLDVAARRLEQVGQEIHDSRIKPLQQALRNCQTLTPILMDGDACRERLREINGYIYDVLGEGRKS